MVVESASAQSRRFPASTVALGGVTLLVLLASAPDSLKSAYRQGGLYLFSESFVTDIPKRLHGPGWFRFILQPVAATVLGLRAGVRERNLKAALAQAASQGSWFGRNYKLMNLLLMGILMDSLLQWAMLGSSYPGAALVVGPALVMAPYAIARLIAMRFAGQFNSTRTKR